MKTNYTAYLPYGSSINFNSNPMDEFSCPSVKKIICNRTGDVLFKREHKKIGHIQTGIKLIGNIHVFECSDSKIRITKLGFLVDDELIRFSRIEKNRKSETKLIIN